MSKLIFLLTGFLSFFGILDGAATIWRVNNNSGVVANFTTLQAAHNGAAAGDTLHIEASATSYGALTCTKRLIIIGTGYFLGENPNTQAITVSSKVDAITFNMGSAGSILLGLDLEGSSVNVYSPDIVIRRCKFNNPSGTNIEWTIGQVNVYYNSNNSGIAANNIVISENYGLTITVNYPSSGILITNNYILRPVHETDGTISNCLLIHANGIALVQNNIFRRGRITANNSNLTNNIMYAGSIVGTGNLISNNLANGTQFGNTSGNQQNVVMSNVFVGPGPGISTDGQWVLKVGSPSIEAGYGSTPGNPIDAGIISGQTPYALAGLPPIPAVYFFQNQPVGSNTDPIDVQIKVKSHN